MPSYEKVRSGASPACGIITPPYSPETLRTTAASQRSVIFCFLPAGSASHTRRHSMSGHQASPGGGPGSANSALPLGAQVIEGRAGLLELVDISRVKCKLCEKTMSGQDQTIAAHFAQQSGCPLSKCSKSTPESVALGQRFLAELDGSRRGGSTISRKRALETNESDNSRNVLLRLQDNKEGGCSGKKACDMAYIRFLVATGQSFGLGESAHFRDFVESARVCDDWTPLGRRTLGTIGLDHEYDKVDTESKTLMAGKGLKRGKTLQVDRWNGKVSLNF